MAQSITSGPSTLNWSVYSGDQNTESFEFLSDGNPWDLTGATIEAQARRTASDDAVALAATVTPIDEAAGTWEIGWDGEDVRALLAGAETWTGVWDLQVLEAGAALPRTFLRGTFTAIADVTRTAAP